MTPGRPADPGPPATPAAARRPRRDAEQNRERILAAAAAVMLRDGRHVPIAAIAAAAGVGVGTLYRSYADRQALLHALEYRAYDLLGQILDDVDGRELTGLAAVTAYLSAVLGIADQLILPLRGAPPLMTAGAVAARTQISRRLDGLIERGRAEGSIRAGVNATDVIVFGAFITQPLPHGPDWITLARRQLAIFTAGLAASPPAALPGPAVTRADLETAFGQPAGG
jgi:AcrR family transcriptional regulator